MPGYHPGPLALLMTRTFPLALALILAGGCSDDIPEDRAADPAGETRVQSNETETVALPEAGGEVEADTTGPASVTVEGATVPTRAVVTDIESGDRACYVTLRTDGGGSETVFADYSLCDTDGLLNRRVQIEYEPGTVLAESCEGDAECLDTETVALAVAAEPID